MNVNIGDNSGLRLASHESREDSLQPMGTCGGNLQCESPFWVISGLLGSIAMSVSLAEFGARA
jgi:hypothetical protein